MDQNCSIQLDLYSISLRQSFREALLIALIVIGVELAVHLALIGVVIYARHSLIKKTGNTTPHIIILLSGIFSFNLFYLIGGILGIVAANNDSEDE